jgi:hypothetical protein
MFQCTVQRKWTQTLQHTLVNCTPDEFRFSLGSPHRPYRLPVHERHGYVRDHESDEAPLPRSNRLHGLGRDRRLLAGKRYLRPGKPDGYVAGQI